MERSWIKRVGYAWLRVFCRLVGVVCFRIRVFGRENLPADGGALVCANHQSFFDPVLVGLICNRRMNYLARSTLFHFALLRWLIEFLDAIPIDREGVGLGGLKETLRRLKRGEMVLIFPEGTRSRDGEVAPLKPGFCAVARRAKVALVPIGLDGAYDAWPRNTKLPRRSRIHLSVGEPILPDTIATLTDEELVAELERRIRACHATARRGREEMRDEGAG